MLSRSHPFQHRYRRYAARCRPPLRSGCGAGRYPRASSIPRCLLPGGHVRCRYHLTPRGHEGPVDQDVSSPSEHSEHCPPGASHDTKTPARDILRARYRYCPGEQRFQQARLKPRPVEESSVITGAGWLPSALAYQHAHTLWPVTTRSRLRAPGVPLLPHEVVQPIQQDRWSRVDCCERLTDNRHQARHPELSQ